MRLVSEPHGENQTWDWFPPLETGAVCHPVASQPDGWDSAMLDFYLTVVPEGALRPALSWCLPAPSLVSIWGSVVSSSVVSESEKETETCETREFRRLKLKAFGWRRSVWRAPWMDQLWMVHEGEELISVLDSFGDKAALCKNRKIKFMHQNLKQHLTKFWVCSRSARANDTVAERAQCTGVQMKKPSNEEQCGAVSRGHRKVRDPRVFRPLVVLERFWLYFAIALACCFFWYCLKWHASLATGHG